MVLDEQQRLIAVWSLDIAGSEIHRTCSVANPGRLAHLGVVGEPASLVRTRQLEHLGASSMRVHRVAACREAPHLDCAERAALALTDAATRPSRRH